VIPQSGGAKSGALPAISEIADPDLAQLITVWPSLPAGVKADIVAMVKASAKVDGSGR